MYSKNKIELIVWKNCYRKQRFTIIYKYLTVPDQPRNLRARPRGPNEIEVTWDAPQDIDQILDYTLYYNDSQKHTNGQVKIVPPTTKYILTELIPDTIYHIQLAARSIRGLGARTILVQAKTPEFSKSCLCFTVIYIS